MGTNGNTGVVGAPTGNAVPEPSGIVLLFTCLAGLVAVTSRFRRTAQ
jgi:hypothetical protein